MKKITLSIVMLVVCAFTGISQENLLTNGDFEQGMVTWFGNAFNVVEDGGNSFNLSDNEIAANPFDVNLSHPVELTAGVTYTLSFEAATSAEDGSRMIVAGAGLNEGDFAAAAEGVMITSDLQLYTLELTPPAGSVNSRVLFDLGGDAGVVVLDNVVLTVDEMMPGDDGDELLENGDFELGMVTWFGNAFNVQTDGGNSFNLSDNEIAANPFDVNLSHPVALEAGVAYTLSFDAATSAEDVSRTILAGIGLNEGDFAAVTEVVTVTADLQTFVFELTPPSGSANSRVIFDLGADDGVLVLDNVSLTLVEDGGGDDPAPLVAAPVPPAREVDAVFSIFSDAYTDQPNVVFGAFNVGTVDITPLDIEGDNFLQIGFVQPDPGFLLVDWGAVIDNTAMTHFHMDIWIDTPLSAGLVVNPILSNHVGDAGETSNFGLTNPVGTFGEWISIDVPFTDFDFGTSPGVQQRDALRQFVLTVAGAETGGRTVFLDNLYLHNDTVLSTEDFETVDLAAFPNPSSDRWMLSSNAQTITSVEVHNILGQRVAAQQPNSNTVAIDASLLSTGMYIATVTTTEGTNSIKLIKN